MKNKKKSKKKSILIVSGFVVLLALTGVLNIMINNKIEGSNVNASNIAVNSGNFFSTYRSDRTDTRNQEILCLDAIISSTSASADAKSTAEAKKSEIVSMMEKELVLEGLIKAKGFEDAIISTTASAINVIVKSAEMTSSEVAQIVDIIQNQTAYTIDNIKIIPVE